jgi:hypothetical protein
MASKESPRVDEQGELLLLRRAEPNDMPIEVVRRQKSACSAFCLACQSSGLEDKEIYGALGIDAGYFSRIKKGEATLQADVVRPFCDVVGNRIYMEWQAYQIGCTLVQIKSEAERLLEAEKIRREKAESENKLMRQLLAGRATTEVA